MIRYLEGVGPGQKDQSSLLRFSLQATFLKHKIATSLATPSVILRYTRIHGGR